MPTSDIPMRWIKAATESLNINQITTLSQLAAVYVNHCIQGKPDCKLGPGQSDLIIINNAVSDTSLLERFFDEALTNYINPTIETLHDGHSNGLTVLIWVRNCMLGYIYCFNSVVLTSHIVGKSFCHKRQIDETRYQYSRHSPKQHSWSIGRQRFSNHCC